MAEAARKKTRVEIPEDLKQERKASCNNCPPSTPSGRRRSREERKPSRKSGPGKRSSTGNWIFSSLSSGNTTPSMRPSTPQAGAGQRAALETPGGAPGIRPGRYSKLPCSWCAKAGWKRSSTIPLGREAMEEKVKAFMDPLLNHRGTGFSTADAKELYDLLLATCPLRCEGNR